MTETGPGSNNADNHLKNSPIRKNFMMLRSLVFLITTATPLVVFAQSPASSSDESSSQQTQQPAVGSASVLYYRDPQTGEVTTPPPEVARLMQPSSVNFSNQGLEMVVLPDGTKKVDLQGRFMMTSVAKTNQEGELVHYCTDHPAELLDAEHLASHDKPVVK